MTTPVCVADFKKLAERKLTEELLSFINIGSYYQETYHDNEHAYKRYKLRPKYLRDVSHLRTDTTILGHQVSCPIGVSPMGLGRLIHPDGEVGVAKACERQGVCYGLSMGATTSLEEIARETPNCLRWFHIQFMKNHNVLAGHIRKAEAAGFTAVFVTVDSPVLGKRFSQLEKPLSIPPELRLPAFEDFGNGGQSWMDINDTVYTTSSTWDDLRWLKRITKLPVVVKGIVTGEGAREAIAAGADAILVSNHGGRQLDCVPATIDALAEVLKAVDGRCEVYVDGGVRCGLDVVKALCMGARAVFVGRPILWGLAVQGSEGAEKVLTILREEFSSGLGLLGASKISDLSRDMVVHQSYYHSRL